MSVIILRDEIVHYEVLGRGRPLIFLHDWVGSWRYWIPSMQAMSISFRTYALDLWGFGDTSKNPNYYSIGQQTELLDEWLYEMGIGKIALVGHGLGAVISLVFASRHPEYVDRVMVIGLPEGEEAINSRLRTASPGDLHQWLVNHTESAQDEVQKTDHKAIQISLSNLGNIDILGLLYGLSTPCLIVHGQDDPAIALPNFNHSAALPKKVHQIVLDECGHFPMLDQPTKFNRLMADFLSLNSGESPRNLQLKEEWKRRVR
jgi:pimeloyl-ACP methyl ester carboxylesterase